MYQNTMDDPMISEFIELIKNINTLDIPETEYVSQPKDIVSNISDIANVLFITEEGHVNYENLVKVKSQGVYIFPLEQDRFGWLVGGVQTDKGIITFG
jgi:hypothetical protein